MRIRRVRGKLRVPVLRSSVAGNYLIHVTHYSFRWEVTHFHHHTRHDWSIRQMAHSYHEIWFIHRRHTRHDSFSYTQLLQTVPHTWMSHVTCKWDTIHPYEIWLIHTRHDSCFYMQSPPTVGGDHPGRCMLQTDVTCKWTKRGKQKTFPHLWKLFSSIVWYKSV